MTRARRTVIIAPVNPDADTTRIVRAEQFLRLVERLEREGLDRVSAELAVALAEPHLACAYEQLRHEPGQYDVVARAWRAQQEAP